MILGFRNQATEQVWRGRRSHRLPGDIQRTARRKLRYLDAAGCLEDLPVPPGNRLEALKGDRDGQHSIRINRQWRICFGGVWGTLSTSRLSTITDGRENGMKPIDRERLPNLHPGEVLLEDFLRPMRINQSELARAIGIPPRRINEMVLGKRAVTAETDLLLTRYFGLSEGLFLRLQTAYDLENAKLSLRDRLTAIRPRDAA